MSTYEQYINEFRTEDAWKRERCDVVMTARQFQRAASSQPVTTIGTGAAEPQKRATAWLGAAKTDEKDQPIDARPHTNDDSTLSADGDVSSSAIDASNTR